MTYHFPPDSSVGGLRWAGIAKYLVRLGWEVSVLTAAPAVGNGAGGGAQVESCPRLWTLVDCYQGLRRSRGSSTSTVHLAGPSASSGLLLRLRSEVAALLAFPDVGRGWVLRAALRARSLVRRFQPHVVVSSGPPHSVHVVARIATIGRPVRWFMDFRDPWAAPLKTIWDSDPQAHIWLARALFPRLERLMIGAAQGVIASTAQLAEALAAQYPDAAVACVPNGVDPEWLPPPPPDPYPGLSIAYAGSLYAGRDLGPVVRALRIFFDRYPTAAQSGSKLRVAGQIEALQSLAFAQAVAAAGLDQHVEVLGPLPRVEALKLVSRSRLAIVLAQHQELQIPAKLYESVALGIPTLVIAAANSAAGVEGKHLGAAVRDAGDVEGIAGLLEHVWRDGSRQRAPSMMPITYDAIAPRVHELFADHRSEPRACG